MKKELTILMANMPINNGNRGCVALSITSMFLIDKILTEKGIKYKFYLTDSGYRENSTYTYSILDKNIEFNICNYPYASTMIDWAKNLVKIRDFKRNITIFKDVDFIFDIGQGDSFSDIYGEKRFNNIDKIHRVFRLLKKPFCLLPQTIGPFKNEKIKHKALKSISKASMVMARDKQSCDFVTSNIPQQKNIGEYIDVAFFMPYEHQTFEENFIHVGLNISGLLWHGGYTKNNQFGLMVDYQDLIKRIIESFLRKENVKVHLIGHVVGGDRHVENDYAVSYDLVRKYTHPNLILAPLFLSPIDAKSYISGMDFFIGARMHAAIAAFSAGVPVYPMAYSRKFNGLFLETLNYSYMGDMLIQDENEIISRMKEAFDQRHELKEIIQNRMKGVVKEREELMKEQLIYFFKLEK